MPESTNPTLMEAARHYLDTLADDERAANQAEVQRFVRWCGTDRHCTQLSGHDVATYAETLTGGTRRGEAVKKFLVFAKKGGYTATNLGIHLRLRKTATKQAAKRAPLALPEIQLSGERKAALEAELESLKAQRPQIVKDLQEARADKDFRENAPLDAARDRQGHVEGRIREVEATLAQAVVVEQKRMLPGDAVDVGSTVHLRNLKSGAETTYKLVRPGDGNAAQGRISSESPVGQALLKRHVGEEVEVAAPSGTLRFRIERVEG